MTSLGYHPVREIVETEPSIYSSLTSMIPLSQEIVTAQKLAAQCASMQWAPSAVRPATAVVEGSDYALSWRAFCEFLREEYEQRRQVNVPSLGAFGFRVLGHGIHLPTLELRPAYLHRHGLTQERCFASQTAVISGFRKTSRFPPESWAAGVRAPASSCGEDIGGGDGGRLGALGSKYVAWRQRQVAVTAEMAADGAPGTGAPAVRRRSNRKPSAEASPGRSGGNGGSGGPVVPRERAVFAVENMLHQLGAAAGR
ncbi:unnamed protein product, partial [Phaeothamnion confervicola]